LILGHHHIRTIEFSHFFKDSESRAATLDWRSDHDQLRRRYL